MYICKFCNKQCKNSNSLKNHERLCKENPDRQITPFMYPDFHKSHHENQFTKAKRLGLSKPSLTQESRTKLSNSMKKYHIDNQPWNDFKRKQHSLIMSGVVKKYPDSYSKNNVCGRVKHIEYNGILLKGSWEVKIAQWLDDQDIIWEYEGYNF